MLHRRVRDTWGHQRQHARRQAACVCKGRRKRCEQPRGHMCKGSTRGGKLRARARAAACDASSREGGPQRSSVTARVKRTRRGATRERSAVCGAEETWRVRACIVTRRRSWAACRARARLPLLPRLPDHCAAPARLLRGSCAAPAQLLRSWICSQSMRLTSHTVLADCAPSPSMIRSSARSQDLLIG